LLVSYETACIHVPLNCVMAATELPRRGPFIRIGLSPIR
jgi:hypothetical protein